MIWAPLAFILILIVVGFMLDEPGRFRPRRNQSKPEPVTPLLPLVETQSLCASPTTLQLTIVRLGKRVAWIARYTSEGHCYVFRFGPADMPRLQREFAAMAVDPELLWSQSDTERVHKHLTRALLEYLGADTNTVSVTDD